AVEVLGKVDTAGHAVLERGVDVVRGSAAVVAGVRGPRHAGLEAEEARGEVGDLRRVVGEGGVLSDMGRLATEDEHVADRAVVTAAAAHRVLASARHT